MGECRKAARRRREVGGSTIMSKYLGLDIHRLSPINDEWRDVNGTARAVPKLADAIHERVECFASGSTCHCAERASSS
jgi:hypothetical protein